MKHALSGLMMARRGLGGTREYRRSRRSLMMPMEALESRVLLSAATHLVIALQPTNGATGQSLAFPLQVELQDANGQVDTTNTSSVHVSIKSGPGGLTGTTTLAAVNGVAEFTDLSFSKAGTYTLQVTDGSLTKDTSDPINIVGAGGPASLVFTVQPVGNPTGGTITSEFDVRVLDINGNDITKATPVTLSIVTGPSGSHLIGKRTISTSSDSHLAAFTGISLDKGGTYVLQAKVGNITVNSDSFTMGGPSVATSLEFVQQPTNTTAGVAITPAPTVRVLDQYGNLMSNNKSPITIQIASGPTTKQKFTVTAKAGVATFSNIKLNTAGTYTLTASGKNLTATTSDSFTVNAAAPTHLAFVTIPTNGSDHTAGTDVTVSVLDKFNNVVLTDTSTVTLSYATSPKNTAPLSITSQAVSGVATFSALTFPSGGKFSLKATDDVLKATTSKQFTLV